MGYANGRAPESALIYVDGIHIAPSAGERVLAFQAWAKTQGREIHVPKLGGYRMYSEQETLWKASNGKGTGGSSVRIASPGTSTHGNYDTGRVDIVGASGYSYTLNELAWIVAHAGSFGLVREFPPGSVQGYDPNHFIVSGAFSGGVPTAVQQEEDDIVAQAIQAQACYYAGNKQYYISAPGLASCGDRNMVNSWLTGQGFPKPEDVSVIQVPFTPGDALMRQILLFSAGVPPTHSMQPGEVWRAAEFFAK